MELSCYSGTLKRLVSFGLNHHGDDKCDAKNIKG